MSRCSPSDSLGQSSRAFSLVGALSIVRFRTVVRDTQDTAYVIFAVAVGMAEGVALADDYVERQLAFADSLNPAMKASMANDLAAGHRMELPWLSGAVVRLGRQHRVPTPVHDTIYAALKPYAGGTPR